MSVPDHRVTMRFRGRVCLLAIAAEIEDALAALAMTTLSAASPIQSDFDYTREKQFADVGTHLAGVIH